jgi:hypothetical protein
MAFEVRSRRGRGVRAWADAQRKPATEPGLTREQRGRDIFMSGSCMLCHAIRGTTAGARQGPDLTHMASRERLAAAARQHARRAGRMDHRPAPAQGRREHARASPAREDLDALVAYLGVAQMSQRAILRDGGDWGSPAEAALAKTWGDKPGLAVSSRRRPQADRDPLRRHGVRVLRGGGPHGRRHAPAARGPEKHPRGAGHVQPALQHARNGDDVPLRGAG